MGSPAWPDYPTPEGIGGDATAVPPTGDISSPTPGTPPAQPQDGSDTPPQDAAGSAEPQVPADDADGASIPKYRFDEVNQGFRYAMEQNTILQRQVHELTQVLNQLARPSAPASAAPAPVQLDEREQRLVAELDRLLQHSPTWQRLAPFIDKAAR